jgi:hypothetical protein
MYNENDKHCNECLCKMCLLWMTDECIEGKNLCDKCDNQSHTSRCGCFYLDD